MRSSIRPVQQPMGSHEAGWGEDTPPGQSPAAITPHGCRLQVDCPPKWIPGGFHSSGNDSFSDRPHRSSVSESQAYSGDITHQYDWDMAAREARRFLSDCVDGNRMRSDSVFCCHWLKRAPAPHGHKYGAEWDPGCISSVSRADPFWELLRIPQSPPQPPVVPFQVWTWQNRSVLTLAGEPSAKPQAVWGLQPGPWGRRGTVGTLFALGLYPCTHPRPLCPTVLDLPIEHPRNILLCCQQTLIKLLSGHLCYTGKVRMLCEWQQQIPTAQLRKRAIRATRACW